MTVKHHKDSLTRRDFLKLAALGIGSLAFRSRNRSLYEPEFPEAELLGRVNTGKVELKARPDADSQTTGALYEDAVVPWLREVAGKNIYRTNQRWVETPEGYIWSPYLQPVQNAPNSPIKSLPDTSLGTGMWVEVSVPYVNLVFDNPPARSPGYQDRIKLGLPVRLYYSQLVWVDEIKSDEQGTAWYRVNEKGSLGIAVIPTSYRGYRKNVPE